MPRYLPVLSLPVPVSGPALRSWRAAAVAVMAALSLVALPVVLPAPAAAQAIPAPGPGQARIDGLMSALHLPDVVAIMRAEGLDHARDLQEGMLGGRGGAGWKRSADSIYDAARMEAMVADLTAAALPDDPALIEPMLDFFGSVRGQRIIELENSARRAMLDPDVDAAARAQAAQMIAADAPELELIATFIEANDLIESNVEGGLNANFAFFLGLRDSGVPAFDVPEREMLADVWAQEGSLREDTHAWLIAYLAMAYRPLPDDDLRAYIAFSRTEAGVALNRALFAAFNEVFVKVSRELGLAAGRVLLEQDI